MRRRADPNQPDLFFGSTIRTRAASRGAARRIRKDRPNLQAMVYGCILAAGERGMTDKEIQAKLRMDGNTERPRRIELVGAGRVVDSGLRRERSTVWVLAK